MQVSTTKYKLQKFPNTRIATTDVCEIGKRKHHVAGLIEFDVSKIRENIREHNRKSTNKVSFISFIISVVACTVKKHETASSFLKGKNKLMIFNDINVSFELNGSAEAYFATSVSPYGGLYILNGKDKGTYKSFTSSGAGAGTIGASTLVNVMQYFYVGDINNFNASLFEGVSTDFQFTFGEGLLGGITISIIDNPYAFGEYIIGVAGGFGVGVGPFSSFSVTTQFTKFYK